MSYSQKKVCLFFSSRLSAELFLWSRVAPWSVASSSPLSSTLTTGCSGGTTTDDEVEEEGGKASGAEDDSSSCLLTKHPPHLLKVAPAEAPQPLILRSCTQLHSSLSSPSSNKLQHNLINDRYNTHTTLFCIKLIFVVPIAIIIHSIIINGW